MPPPSTNAKPMATSEELNANTSPTSSAPNKTKLKVNLSRLDPEHIKRMEHSVSEFAKNSPETAKKIGVIRNETDMFELIKADDRTSKRKNTDDGPLCKCISRIAVKICNDYISKLLTIFPPILYRCDYSFSTKTTANLCGPTITDQSRRCTKITNVSTIYSYNGIGD